MLAAASHTLAGHLYSKLPYDTLRDFTPVSMMLEALVVFAGHPSLPAANLRELIAHAKSNPGKLNLASNGNGSNMHLSLEMLKGDAGVDITHVAYKGVPPALTDLIGGHLEMSISGVPILVPHIKSQRLRAIGIGSLKRFPAIPDVPTFDESGLKGYEASTWFGLLAPAKTPRDIVTKVNVEVGKVLASKDIRERYLVEGLEPQGGTPEAFTKFILAEIELYRKLATAANLPKL